MANLVYRVSSRTGRAVSQKRNNSNNNKPQYPPVLEEANGLLLIIIITTNIFDNSSFLGTSENLVSLIYTSRL